MINEQFYVAKDQTCARIGWYALAQYTIMKIFVCFKRFLPHNICVILTWEDSSLEEDSFCYVTSDLWQQRLSQPKRFLQLCHTVQKVKKLISQNWESIRIMDILEWTNSHTPCWSVLELWKIKLEKSILTNWIFSLQ